MKRGTWKKKHEEHRRSKVTIPLSFSNPFSHSKKKETKTRNRTGEINEVKKKDRRKEDYR